MQDNYRKQWENLGKSDPYWAVLTDPSKKGEKWGKNEFFQTGEAEVDNLFRKLSEHNIEVKLDSVLDFGCGVGRLSRGLAKRFNKVKAIDISSEMLKEATRVNSEFRNIEFIHNSTTHIDSVKDESIDLLYSNIVLQHIPTGNQVKYLREFCRIINPNGIIVIQIPSTFNLSHWSGWVHMILGNKVMNIFRKIKYGSNSVMELHCLKKEKVLNLFSGLKMDVLKVERHDSAGDTFISYMYYVQKPS